MVPFVESRLPHDPILLQLLKAAQQTSDTETIIFDALGFEKSYPELLADILQTRDVLRMRLPSAVSEQGIFREPAQNVAIFSKSGYEFLVAFFTIRSMGGACMPLSPSILPEEAEHFITVGKVRCMLFGKNNLNAVEIICAHIQERGNLNPVTAVAISSNAKSTSSLSVGIDDALPLDPDGPGLVIFTSGSTGLPKGAVLPRRCLADPAPVKPGAALSYNPSHWIGGVRSLITPVLRGKKLYIIEVKSGKPRAEAVLATIRNHRITDATFTPALLRYMKEVLTEESGNSLQEMKNECSAYFEGFSAIRCTAGAIELPTREFWIHLTGLPFANFYGLSETGGRITRGTSAKKGSIGTPLPGVMVKLSEGDYGELCVKSPEMFTHYLGDNNATQAAFDDEGYFKTGDLGKFEDGEYIFAGRANTDYVTFGVSRFSTLPVESSLMDLPYIAEACVVGVPNNDAKQLCGAVIRLKGGVIAAKEISLARIRADLETSLSPLMLPTLLYILQDVETLPRTISGKPIKRQILVDFFQAIDGSPPEAAPPRVERCKHVMPAAGQRTPWDGCGLQRGAY